MEQLLRDADAACYAAKEEGRNRVHVYQARDMTNNVLGAEDRSIGCIRDALAEDRFLLYYQPIYPVRVRAQRGKHYEILLRMVDTEGNLLSPGAFIHTAERHGLASAIDRWVVTNVIDWLAKHPGDLNDLYLASVNLSGTSLSDDSFVKYLEHQLAQHSNIAARLCFEITETTAITNPRRIAYCIKALRKFGCLFALDDFGSGAASFEYLKSLPVDFVKIDGAFVKNIARDPVDYLMVSSINEIATAMGMQTIAEYVENQTVYEKLFDMGVSFVQGFGLAEPRPLTGMELQGNAVTRMLNRREAG